MTVIETTADSTTTPESVPRRRRRARILIGVPIVALGLAAAGWAVLHEDAGEATSFACEADGVTAVMPNYGTSPIEACAALWESGGMVSGVTTAPSLSACVDNSSVVVIESDGPDTCESAGLAGWNDQPAYEAAGTAIEAALIGFHDRFLETGNGCATEAQWRSALAEQPGTAGWKVDADRIEASRQCYNLGYVDPTDQSVTIIGVSGQYSIGCDPRTGC